MIKYCREFQCIEFPNEGDYWMSIKDIIRIREDGMNSGYYHLLTKQWFKKYIKDFKKLMKSIDIEIDYEKNEQHRIESVNSIAKMFNSIESHVNKYGFTEYLPKDYFTKNLY